MEVSDRLVGQRRITSGRKTGSYSAEDIDVISLERTRSLCSAYANTMGPTYTGIPTLHELVKVIKFVLRSK